MVRYSNKSTKSSSSIAPDQHPRSLKYYLSDKKYHVSIGKFATKGFVQVKLFLAKELPLPSIAGAMFETAEAGYVRPLAASGDDQKPDIENDIDSVSVPDKQESGKEHQKTVNEIKQFTKRSNEVLCSAKTVWPFALFTDHIVLDRTKLTITKKDFFLSTQVMSMRIEDILNVSTDVGPFMGSISVAIRIMNSDDHVTIGNLKRRDATHLKHIIQGYVIAQHNNIDVAHLDREELIETLTDLGHDLNR